MNEMPGIAAVDALEVPRARDDFREASTLTQQLGPHKSLPPFGVGRRDEVWLPVVIAGLAYWVLAVPVGAAVVFPEPGSLR